MNDQSSNSGVGQAVTGMTGEEAHAFWYEKAYGYPPDPALWAILSHDAWNALAAEITRRALAVERERSARMAEALELIATWKYFGARERAAERRWAQQFDRLQEIARQALDTEKPA